MVGEIDIERLALLARIKLDSKEKDRLQNEFEGILNYVSELKRVDASGIDDRMASKTIELENVARKDKSPHIPGEFSEVLLREAPDIVEGFVRVKHILE